MYEINEIVTFKTADGELNGIIKGMQSESEYYIKGLNAKTYFKSDNEIVCSIGKAYVNEARKNAESWQKEKYR